MIGRSIAHYTITAKIGQGGMGEVYLAEDSSLNRKVALKFLPEQLRDDPMARRRFLREAQSAAALDHPYICKIYEVGEVDGHAFIAMEYVEGRTLKERLNEEPLSTRETLKIALEIAEALEKAHSRGIVHRDLKPANIMVTQEGHAKVMDFGLATRIMRDGGAEEDITTALTREGTTLGTLTYMPPEQLRGQPPDPRSDIFSFGVVLYEMLTGVHPFRAESQAETIHAILGEEPRSISRYRQGVTDILDHTVQKMLAKSPDDRFQSFRGVMTCLEELQGASASSTATILASPHWGKRLRTAGVVLAILALAAVAIVSLGDLIDVTLVDEKVSLAMLPLANLSPEEGQDYVAEGVSDDLMSELQQIGNFRVISKQSVLRYRDTEKMPTQIARELSAGGAPVDFLVGGSVALEGESVRLRLELTRPEPEQVLWTRSYEEPLSRVPDLQRRVVRDIADYLEVTLTEAEQQRVEATAEVSPEAYRTFLKASYYLRSDYTVENHLQGVDLFRKAIDLDPGFAPAWAGLSRCYYFHTGFIPGEESVQKGVAAAREALKLDDSLADAHHALALTQGFQAWQEAEQSFSRAIELNPSDADIRLDYSRLLMFLGRFPEAIAQCQEAIRLDPLTDLNIHQLGFTYFYARRYDDAIEQYQKFLKSNPDHALTRLQLSWPYSFKGMHEEAVDILQQCGEECEGPSAAYVYAVAGREQKAREILARMEASVDEHPAMNRAIVYFGLGDKDRGFELLEEELGENPGCNKWLFIEPYFDDLREDPRFQSLLQRCSDCPPSLVRAVSS